MSKRLITTCFGMTGLLLLAKIFQLFDCSWLLVFSPVLFLLSVYAVIFALIAYIISKRK